MGYRTVQSDYANVWCMPRTTQSKTLSGMILEANASSEYRNVGPYFYEEYLKDRYANGVTGRECFDILRQSIIYDFGRAGQRENLGTEGLWRPCFQNGHNNTFVASYRAQATAKATSLQEVLDAYAKYVEN